MKILLIQLRRIGDILLCTPAIRALRGIFPEDQIDFLCEVSGRPVLETNPALSRVLTYDPRHPIQEMRTVRRQRYDAVIDLMGNPRTAHLTAVSGARYRVGYKRWGRTFMYNVPVATPHDRLYVPKNKLYLIRRWLEKIGVSFGDPAGIRPDLTLTDEDNRFARDWMAKEGLEPRQYVVMAPVHRHPIRQWRADGFRDVAIRIRKESPYKVFLAYGPGEENRVKDIRNGVEDQIGLLPPTSIRQMGSLFKNARVVLTNDSGPMHVAVSVGAPTATIYGPTLPIDWNPRPWDPDHSASDRILQANDVACLGCHLARCPHGHLCMTHLSSSTVFRTVQQYL